MKCCSCKKYIRIKEQMSLWICEVCGGEHHKKCSGEYSGGTGEYPDEDAYSICEKCINK